MIISSDQQVYFSPAKLDIPSFPAWQLAAASIVAKAKVLTNVSSLLLSGESSGNSWAEDVLLRMWPNSYKIQVALKLLLLLGPTHSQ